VRLLIVPAHRSRADASSNCLAAGRPTRGVGEGGEHVRIPERPARFYRRGRHPVRDDVVVNLFARRQLDQLDAAFAPVPERLDPIARAALEARLVVLIVPEVTVTLHEAEALRIF